MFFRKPSPESRPSSERSGSGSASTSPPKLTAIPGGAPKARLTPIRNAAIAPLGDNVGPVLDALGGVLNALARFPLDLPDRSGEETSRELGRWHRHATMGYPLEVDGESAAVGISDRDWHGIVRTVAELRREEHRYVSTAVTELRDALWACVETVHNALKVDHVTDSTAEQQMERAKHALTRLQTGSIKQEVLGAVTAIEHALHERREQQQEQYASLAGKLDRLGRQLEEARKESTTDGLTGLGNRKLFDMMGPRAIQMHSLSRQPVALLMADLDKLKLVNDMYGHQAGDQAIAGLAKALSKVFLRQSDVLCRLGGDEFAAILHNTDWKVAQTLAERLQQQVAEMPNPHPAMEFSVGVSVGVAQLETGEELEHWVERADQALYQAKRNGRSRVCVAGGDAATGAKGKVA
jgi:diguanylate cyclase (GGDEF)-like protein